MAQEYPLGLALDPENADLMQQLHRLEEYDFSEVTVLCQRKYGWSEEKAKELERITKQFLALAFIDWGHPHLPTEDIDQYWHRMILQTRWYATFCNDIFGFYFHHGLSPFAEKTGEGVKEAKRTEVLMNHFFRQPIQLVAECSGGGHGVLPIEPDRFMRSLRPSAEKMPAELQ